MRWFVVCFAMLGAAGCAEVDVTTPPVLVTPTVAGAEGIDIYAGARANGRSAPRFRGQETVTVRAVRRFAEGGAEVAGPRCTLDSGVFEARFTTPARVVVPDYGPDSPDLFVRCTAGDLSGTASAEVFNATVQARGRSSVGFSTGTNRSSSIGVRLLFGPRVDPDRDDFEYPDMRVVLR